MNVRDRQVEIYRDPVADAGSVTGFRYVAHQVAKEFETISPLAKPGAQLKIAEMLLIA